MTIANPNVLLTGFEPFGGERINPSRRDRARARRRDHQRASRRHGDPAGRVRIDAADARGVARNASARLVLATGQAGGRSEIAIERVAANLIDARIADADGVQPIDEPVIADAPAAYFSTLPVKAMLARLRALGIPAAFRKARALTSAIRCSSRWRISSRRAIRGTRAGFIHVPWLPEQAARHHGQPSMALETMVAGVRAAHRVRDRDAAAICASPAATCTDT